MAESGDLGDLMLAALARVRSRIEELVNLNGSDREMALEQLTILLGLRGLELEFLTEAKKYMPLVVDLMENRIVRDSFERDERRGESKVLTAQLTQRFGRLPEWAAERLAAADTKEPKAWSLRILDARTLEEVFD
jgi:hypothetical protein